MVITETDKSKQFAVVSKDQYRLSGLKHTSKDQEISANQPQKLQNVVNFHSEWLSYIFGAGCNCYQSDRVGNSMNENSESVAPLYLLVKDHKGWSESMKTPPPSRPLSSGNRGFNKHLSELVSLILEPLAHSCEGHDVNSTGSFLHKINELNIKRKHGGLREQKDGVENCKKSYVEMKNYCVAAKM